MVRLSMRHEHPEIRRASLLPRPQSGHRQPPVTVGLFWLLLENDAVMWTDLV